MALPTPQRSIAARPFWTGPNRSILKAAGDQAEIARLLDQQASIEANIKQSFLDAVRRLGDSVDTARVADLLRQGKVGEAIGFVNETLSAQGFSTVASSVSQAALAAGIDAAAAPALGSASFGFGVTNPQTVSFLRNYEFGLIRDLTMDARASVAAAIQHGVEAGINPIDTARDVRDYLGLTPRQTQAVLNYRDALVDGDSSALDRALRDKRFDPSVERALRGDGDLSPDKIDRMVQRYQERYLRYRSETIARTESMRAVNRGNLEAWRQAANDGVVAADQIVRFWVHSHDEKVRDSHLAIPDMNPDGVGLDEPFDSPLGPIMYPCDPNAEPSNTINCRCTQIIRFLPTGEDFSVDDQDQAAQD